MGKYTVTAPANIAFIKYWGMADLKKFLPLNSSLSMTLSGCTTVTTAMLTDSADDIVEIQFDGMDFETIRPDSIKSRHIFAQIDRIRALSHIKKKVHIRSKNNFPQDAGIASSASGFSALTGALLLSYGLHQLFEDKIEFSRQVRLCGSGSAVRSVYGGFVEFTAGSDHVSAVARQIAPENHWDLVDIIAVVETEKKKISSSEGHAEAQTSPFLASRVTDVQKRYPLVVKALLEKDIETLGREIEHDSFSMHAVMMTQTPPALYLSPGSLDIIRSVWELRESKKAECYVTFDAGANAHIICRKNDADIVMQTLKKNPYVKRVIYNEATEGVHITENHL